MKPAFCYTVLFLLLLSCKKSTNFVIVPAQTSAFSIKIDQVINDSSIVLKWSKFNEQFQKYRLVRTASYIRNGVFGTYIEAVDSSKDVNHVSFTETKMPFAGSISYDIYAINDTTRSYYFGIAASARINYQRPNGPVKITPVDVLIDKETKKLYITEQKKVMVVDYNTGRQITSKDFTVTTGYCSLGKFNGTPELYVPLNDGWLQILDAATLELIDKIYVGGFGIASVIAANGKLFISSSDQISSYDNCLKVYDRAAKNLIGRTGDWTQTRLLYLEGSATEMIDLTINLMPIDLNYYQFSATGAPLVKKADSYHGDFPMDANIVRSFPDGSKFITSSSGTIFNKSLLFDRYVKQNGTYSDFAFNDIGSLIYASDAQQKRIDIISYPATTKIGSFSTSYYPYKIFRDGNTLISVSKTDTYYQQATYLLIEKINL